MIDDMYQNAYAMLSKTLSNRDPGPKDPEPVSHAIRNHRELPVDTCTILNLKTRYQPLWLSHDHAPVLPVEPPSLPQQEED